MKVKSLIFTVMGEISDIAPIYVVLVIFLFLGKMPDLRNLVEDRFILTHDFRDSSPWSAGSIPTGMR